MNKQRWGSIVWGTESILEFELSLRKLWSVAKYNMRDNSDTTADTKTVEEIDISIGDPAFLGEAYHAREIVRCSQAPLHFGLRRAHAMGTWMSEMLLKICDLVGGLALFAGFGYLKYPPAPSLMLLEICATCR